MRIFQFILALANLAFCLYLFILNLLKHEAANAQTFFWTLLYLATSLAMLHLFTLYMSNKLDEWYDAKSLNSIRDFALVLSILCAIAICIYLGLEYYKSKHTLSLKKKIMKPFFSNETNNTTKILSWTPEVTRWSFIDNSTIRSIIGCLYCHISERKQIQKSCHTLQSNYS